MTPKVLVTLNWMYNQPDGDNSVSLVVDDFDIHDQEEKIRVGRQALIDYGVNPETIRFNEDSLLYSFAFEAEIGEFHRPLPKTMKPYTKTEDVEVIFQYVLEHRGRIYTPLKELDAFIMDPKTYNQGEQ